MLVQLNVLFMYVLNFYMYIVLVATSDIGSVSLHAL